MSVQVEWRMIPMKFRNGVRTQLEWYRRSCWLIKCEGKSLAGLYNTFLLLFMQNLKRRRLKTIKHPYLMTLTFHLVTMNWRKLTLTILSKTVARENASFVWRKDLPVRYFNFSSLSISVACDTAFYAIILLRKKPCCTLLTAMFSCINRAIHVLLIHGFVILRMSIPGQSQKLTTSSVTCTEANVIQWHQDDVIVFALEAAFSKRSHVMFSAPL